jgi:hypothetical protein
MRLFRHARAIVATTIATRREAAACYFDLAPRRGPLFDGLQGIAAQIGEHAKQLVAVGIDAQRLIDIYLPGDGPFARQAQPISHFFDQRAQATLARGAGSLFRAPEFERAPARLMARPRIRSVSRNRCTAGSGRLSSRSR